MEGGDGAMMVAEDTLDNTIEEEGEAEVKAEVEVVEVDSAIKTQIGEQLSETIAALRSDQFGNSHATATSAKSPMTSQAMSRQKNSGGQICSQCNKARPSTSLRKN